MKHHVFGDCERNFRRVEEAADEDCVVGQIEPTEHISCFSSRPGKAWLRQSIRKVLLVEPVEQLIEIDIASSRSSRPSEPAAVVSNETRAFLNFVAQDKHPIRQVIGFVDFLSVKLREEN